MAIFSDVSRMLITDPFCVVVTVLGERGDKGSLCQKQSRAVVVAENKPKKPSARVRVVQ